MNFKNFYDKNGRMSVCPPPSHFDYEWEEGVCRPNFKTWLVNSYMRAKYLVSRTGEKQGWLFS